MKKRVLSLFLVLSMLLSCVPMLVLPVLAEESEGKTVTVTFQTANGTVVSRQEYPAGYLWL